MSNNKFEEILIQIAKKNHSTPENVRKEMQYAMDMAMASSDPAVQARWATVPRKGERPTLEEFVCYMVSKPLS
ncbi:MAG: sporulation initiation factor Spo0A [Oscillospiraceae bacterium]|nr:sporulation initiation factor Spo0A [Oscillospiraceae bacterium]